jgi:low affinity Fe/Cu permease
MIESTKKTIVRTITGSMSAITVFIVLLLHNAWGDDRYELRSEAIEKEIRRIDTQLTIDDQEILFAESDKQKAKFIAIKAIHQREKEALREKLKEKG